MPGSRWQGKYVIGLTGNIAVGKSLVRQSLQELGAYAIDADQIARGGHVPPSPGPLPPQGGKGSLLTALMR